MSISNRCNVNFAYRNYRWQFVGLLAVLTSLNLVACIGGFKLKDGLDTASLLENNAGASDVLNSVTHASLIKVHSTTPSGLTGYNYRLFSRGSRALLYSGFSDTEKKIPIDQAAIFDLEKKTWKPMNRTGGPPMLTRFFELDETHWFNLGTTIHVFDYKTLVVGWIYDVQGDSWRKISIDRPSQFVNRNFRVFSASPTKGKYIFWAGVDKGQVDENYDGLVIDLLTQNISEISPVGAPTFHHNQSIDLTPNGDIAVLGGTDGYSFSGDCSLSGTLSVVNPVTYHPAGGAIFDIASLRWKTIPSAPGFSGGIPLFHFVFGYLAITGKKTITGILCPSHEQVGLVEHYAAAYDIAAESWTSIQVPGDIGDYIKAGNGKEKSVFCQHSSYIGSGNCFLGDSSGTITLMSKINLPNFDESRSRQFQIAPDRFLILDNASSPIGNYSMFDSKPNLWSLVHKFPNPDLDLAAVTIGYGGRIYFIGKSAQGSGEITWDDFYLFTP